MNEKEKQFIAHLLIEKLESLHKSMKINDHINYVEEANKIQTILNKLKVLK